MRHAELLVSATRDTLFWIAYGDADTAFSDDHCALRVAGNQFTGWRSCLFFDDDRLDDRNFYLDFFLDNDGLYDGLAFFLDDDLFLNDPFDDDGLNDPFAFNHYFSFDDDSLDDLNRYFLLDDDGLDDGLTFFFDDDLFFDDDGLDDGFAFLLDDDLFLNDDGLDNGLSHRLATCCDESYEKQRGHQCQRR